MSVFDCAEALGRLASEGLDVLERDGRATGAEVARDATSHGGQ